MIKIDKQMRNYIEENGCKFGDELHRSYGKNKTYYATESKKVLKLIEEYKSKVKVVN